MDFKKLEFHLGVEYMPAPANTSKNKCTNPKINKRNNRKIIYRIKDEVPLLKDYIKYWLNTAELAPKTRDQYNYLSRRIITSLGDIPLNKITASHLNCFYSDLRKEVVNTKCSYAKASKFEYYKTKLTISNCLLSKLTNLSETTISEASKGKHIKISSAEKIANAMSMETELLFDLHLVEGHLSTKTIHHHHSFIRTILASAKRENLIKVNVASEYIKPPQKSKAKAKYLTDVQAKQFVKALLDEPDIRIKTALTILIFSGVRRGELLGLEWEDIDFIENIININRASQYVMGQGIIEVPPKNETSVRGIHVPDYVMALLSSYRCWWNNEKSKMSKNWIGNKNRLFVTKVGTPLFPDTINYWLNSFIVRNSLPKVSPHNLRHTFATLQLVAGVDLRTLQSRTGHAQASTLLNTYAHVIKSAQERASSVLNDILLDVPVNDIEIIKTLDASKELDLITDIFKNSLIKLLTTD